jgi:hypothetical protein
MSADAKFSEGEWWLGDDGRTVYAGRADEDAPGVYPWPGKALVCEVWDTVEGLEGDDPVADANARLISAGPALYEACRMVHQVGLTPDVKRQVASALIMAEEGGDT